MTKEMNETELADMAEQRYTGIMIGSRDLSENEVKRVARALRLASLIADIATDARTL